MKSFMCKKTEEEKCIENNSICEFNINNKKGFNYIIINNSENSKNIYIIDSIKLYSKNVNKVCLLLEENYSNNDFLDKKEDINLEYKNIQDNEESFWDKYMFSLKDNFQILRGYSIILIPGGSLFIKLKKNMQQAKLKVNLIKEKI